MLAFCTQNMLPLFPICRVVTCVVVSGIRRRARSRHGFAEVSQPTSRVQASNEDAVMPYLANSAIAAAVSEKLKPRQPHFRSLDTLSFH